MNIGISMSMGDSKTLSQRALGCNNKDNSPWGDYLESVVLESSVKLSICCMKGSICWFDRRYENH